MKTNEIAIIDEQSIKDMVHEIRGQRVMLDFDLARIYGYETRYLNRQVLRNSDRFPAEFRFKLSREETRTILMCQNVTSSWGGARRLPFAFTEQGVYMLMTVLKGELAVKQSIALIKAFKTLKDAALTMSNDLPVRLGALEERVANQGDRIAAVESRFSDFVKQFTPPAQEEWVMEGGQAVEAAIAYERICSRAKKTVLVIDDYIGNRTLRFLKFCKPGVSITLVSDNRANPKLESSDLEAFARDTKNSNPITLISNRGRCHDRFVVLDCGLPSEKAYLCGPSSKDAGNRLGAIVEIHDQGLIRAIYDSLNLTK